MKCLVVQCRKKVVAARLSPSQVETAVVTLDAFPFPIGFPSKQPCLLVLAALEKPLCHLVLLNDVNVRAPAGQGISVNGVQ